jgi:hypothetical protein
MAKSRFPSCFELPISDEDLEDLLDWLEFRRTRCNHTLRGTRYFLRRRNLPVRETIDWLGSMGGYCDCEVSLNVRLTWLLFCDDD